MSSDEASFYTKLFEEFASDPEIAELARQKSIEMGQDPDKLSFLVTFPQSMISVCLSDAVWRYVADYGDRTYLRNLIIEKMKEMK